MRQILSFNDNWTFKRGDDSAPIAVTLPHTWNAVDGQDGGNDYWRGTSIYTKGFAKPSITNDERCFIEFKGAAMTCDIKLNGQSLCHHEGGYSTFRAEITDLLTEQNEISVSVDNSVSDTVYPQKADFTFYGGLYRDVNLITVPSHHFELLKDGTPGIKVTPIVDLEQKSAKVTVETWQNSDEEVTITVNNEEKKVTSKDGHAIADFTIANVHLWDGIDDPYLYTASAMLQSGDQISCDFGCRHYVCDPQKGFILNGRSYPLRGVSRHQDRKGLGNALTIKEHEEDMEFIREIGANTIRLAHYQHSQEFYDLCDKYGMVVWAEIPYITMHMPGGCDNTLSQMRELITQCYNHPSIVCWGLSNEITASGKVDEDLMDNHRLLNDLCHKMDKTRPTVMAHAFMLEKDSPLIPIADIASYNLYFGWYLGELEQNDEFFDEYHEMFPDRVIGFSEYGADANPTFQTSEPEKGDYSETYQCVYHEHMLRLINERPWLWATHVWNMFDFAADGRDEGGKQGVNQKGLVTMDRKIKKDAFYLYKAAWNHKEPFVHLCGSRYKERCEKETQIKVYSNQPEVELYVDNILFEKKSSTTVFEFKVPITGKHEIIARAAGSEDSMTITYVDEPNTSYEFKQKGHVINWFDKETFRDDCFSLRNTMGELMAHPEASKILAEFMKIAHEKRGDVAKATAGNKNLEKMMSGIKMESLIKQAGDSITPEQVTALNAALQKIPLK